MEAACCEGNGAVLFIGIEERGAPHFDTRPAPVGNATLPEEVMTAYRDFVVVAERAIRDSPDVRSSAAVPSCVARSATTTKSR